MNSEPEYQEKCQCDGCGKVVVVGLGFDCRCYKYGGTHEAYYCSENCMMASHGREPDPDEEADPEKLWP